ncbi:MAG: hypothetical protein UR69_C0002G0250 [Candidatus Moranbacteria bacterium GW2011_GWE2_35_2-]|nr:MAG: hypothetical protein UR69_C0002G0250 [Candidatus Moranbacteria bacterium GW2011_GWE2_35_2-]KKQ06854.1 MAG: hypothetical protein US15_C0002G0007 [Candidatus Moranbacteria bacterium GW2011_GWF1_36_4]KKQ22403.1 MAG: hypothetical protein US37_C0002G0028 [Candidatus Moranbacteria bacterium GW2011_GWF2_37_11]KKQ29471.1 MAG: hypothetical protein US44_C0001G0063 [Candidatus Moranbacteria bacterium GW2011_GWD1_37_17]KKQ30660.1 MAG: hypothetical protein US47_C0002G0250 [Candidatus Moranbacteria b
MKSLSERKEELQNEFETIVVGRFLNLLKKKMEFESWKILQQMVENGEKPEIIKNFLQSKVDNYQDLLQNIVSEMESDMKNNNF